MASQHDPQYSVDTAPDAITPRSEPFWKRNRVLLLLLLILSVSTFFRFYGRIYDQFTSQNPDESSIIHFTTPYVNWPSSIENFLDPRTSTWNTRRDQIGPCSSATGCEFPWGAFPIYLERASAWVLDMVLPPTESQPDGYWVENFQGTMIVGRSLASIFDLITIILVFLIARRLYSSGTALIAAALYGFAVTAIQIAHFFIVESFLVTFITATVYFSVVLMQRPSWWAAAGAGLSLGLAVASKVSVAPVALVVIAAVVLRAAYRKKTRKLGAEFGDPIGVAPASVEERQRSFGSHLLRGFRYLFLAGACSVLGLSIGEPYVLWSFDFSTLSQGLDAFLNSNPWTRRIKGEAAVQSGVADVPYTRQYVGTTPVVYQLEQLVFWGLGIFPGLAAVTGFAVGIWNAIRRRPAEILLMSAALPYFYTIAPLQSKWMRYMLPLVPLFCILGAAFLVRGIIWARSRYTVKPEMSRRASRLVLVQRNVFPALAALSIGWAFLWAVAFMNIYSQPHAKVQASAWFYDNVPDGARIGQETGWDVAIPLSLPPANGKDRSFGARYPQMTEIEMYEYMPPEQALERIRTWLRGSDYLEVPTNRVYAAVTRMPWAYPVQIKYYELLFAEKLGFVKVHTTQVTPELFGFKINDQPADESFTVYDHPRVDVFKKVTELTDEQFNILFSPALNRPVPFIAGTKGSVEDDKGLSYSQPVNTMPQLDDYAWNPLGQENTQWIALVLWLALVELLGLIALPIVFTVFRNVPDRGYPIAKLAALLIVAWGMWIAASGRVIPFTVWGVLLMVLLMAGLSAVCWRLGAGAAIREFFRTRRNLIFAYEAVFLVAFAAVLMLRIANPDLWHTYQGGEKPMEIGFLNSVLRSAWMPPLDPFFSGGFINYYYYGYFVIGCLIKVTGIHPAIAFNLAVPLFYGLTFTAAMSVVYNLVAWSQKRRGSTHAVSRSGLVFGVLAGFLMLVIGNLHGLWQWLVIAFPAVGNLLLDFSRNLGLVEQSLHANYEAFNYWDASRIIGGTINEFPYWTFLFADLHPHLIDMPFTILAVLFTQNLLFAGGYRKPLALTYGARNLSWGQRARLRIASTLSWLWGSGFSGVLTFGLMALTLGALLVINSWDFPTFLGLGGGGAVLALLLLGRRGEVDRHMAAQEPEPGAREMHRLTPGDRWAMFGVVVSSIVALAALALLYYLPFFLNFKAFYTAIRFLVDGGQIENTFDMMRRTTLAEFFIVWGLFVFVSVSYLVYRLWQFPWSDALRDLLGTVPAATPRQTRDLASGAAFRILGRADQGRRSGRLVPALAAAGGTTGTAPSIAFFRQGTAEDAPEDQDESVAPQDGTGTGANGSTAHTGELTLPNGNDDSSLAATVEGSENGSWLSTDHRPTDPKLRVRRRLAPPRPPVDTSPADVSSGNGSAPPPVVVTTATLPVAEVTSPAVAVGALVARPGIIPLWAGLGMLGITAALVMLQIVTGQWLLALLIALIGGIAATTLSTSRTAANYFCGLLLLGALIVAMGVEIVYLADHLRGGPQYRMNTVFKFYMQVWVLWAMAGGAAVYYIIYGIRESIERRRGQVGVADTASTDRTGPSPETRSGNAGNAPAAPTGSGDGNAAAEPSNWIVWSTEHALEPVDYEPEVIGWYQPQVVAASPAAEASSVGPETASEKEDDLTASRWNPARLAWLGVFGLFIVASLAFTFLGTPDRLVKRFGITPPVGTLNGQRFMEYATYSATYDGAAPPVQVNLKYDYEAINWLNNNVRGVKVLAELPREYYRAYGMRAAANTGQSMVVGGLHQDEQRYGWLVGDRRADIDNFFRTADVQAALTYISKYDIDYIYLGQLEQAWAGKAGMQKFEQLADPKVNILRVAFQTQQPTGIPGTIIYEVVREPGREVKTLLGAPVENSGIPGISITPLPTPTATPMPTPPTDDPELQQLIAQVVQDPTNLDNRFKLVEWYRKNNFPLDAARELEVMVAQDPQNIALRHMLGDAYQQGGEPDKALKAWEDARDVDVNNPAGHNKVGIAYLDRKRYDDAIREFQITIEKEPTFVEAYYHMGVAYQAKGERDNAIAAFENVIKNAPAGAEGWKDAATQRLSELR